MTARRSVVSSALAPVVLIGGWSLAAAVQPAGYSSRRDTISALAAQGTPHRWVMTAAFVALGVAHLVTASGLRDAAAAARATLAVGGLATVAVAVFPLPAHGSAGSHVAAATVAFIALGLWPAVGGRGSRPGLLAARYGRPAAVVLIVLVLVFVFSRPRTPG